MSSTPASRSPLDGPLARDVLVVLSLLAMHPVLDWTARRAIDGSDEPLGVVALVAAVVLVLRRRFTREDAAGQSQETAAPTGESPPPAPGLWEPTLVLLGYAVSYPWLTPLPRGILAATGLALLLSRCYFDCRLQWGLWGLLLLGLPLVASLQFYLGYPLRCLVAELAAVLVELAGFAVQVEGVALRSGEHRVIVDAPCSGIKMLWAGGFLTSLLVCVERFRPARALAVFVAAGALIVTANVIRATSLFYLETSNVSAAEDHRAWIETLHTGAGLIAFGGMLVALFFVVRALREKKQCAA